VHDSARRHLSIVLGSTTISLQLIPAGQATGMIGTTLILIRSRFDLDSIPIKPLRGGFKSHAT